MRTSDQPALGWTVVLRRQPVRIVAGQPEGGYADVFELVCCYCGDHPELDYRDVPPRLQRIRGPYLLAAGVAAYDRHLKLSHEQVPDSPGRRTDADDRQGVAPR
jgi:hypothetical protein